jgi:hypothetical protein
MKKLLCSLTLIAFAVAVQAGETKATTTTQKTDKTACCAQKTSTQVKAMADSKSACCSGGSCKDAPSRQALLSPKAASELAKR